MRTLVNDTIVIDPLVNDTTVIDPLINDTTVIDPLVNDTMVIDPFVNDTDLSPNDLFRMSRDELIRLDTAKINWEAWNHYNLYQDLRSRLVALVSTLHNSLQNESSTIVPLMELHTLTKKYEYISEILKLKKLEERRAANQHIDNWMRLIAIQMGRYNGGGVSDDVLCTFYISYVWLMKDGNKDIHHWKWQLWRSPLHINIEFNNSEVDENYLSTLRSWCYDEVINDIALIKVFNYAAERYQRCKEVIYKESTTWMTENNSDHIIDWLEFITNEQWWEELWESTDPFNLFIDHDINVINTLREKEGLGWSMLITMLFMINYSSAKYEICELLSPILIKVFFGNTNTLYSILQILRKMEEPATKYPPIETIKDELIANLDAYLLHKNRYTELHNLYIKEFIRYLRTL